MADADAVDGRDPQGSLDRYVGRGARGLGVHRPALRHGGGLLLPGRHPRRRRRGCWPGPRRAGSARRSGAPTTSARPGRRRPTARSASPRAPTPPSSGSGSWCPAPRTASCTPAPSPAAVWRSTDRGETFALEQALWDHPHRTEWGAGFGGQAFHTVLPHPTDPQSVTAALSTGGVYQTTDGGASWEAAQPGHPGGVPARGPAVPRVRPVRPQDHPPPGPARAALPAEPRRGLPLRRRGPVWKSIADGLPADFGFPIVVHPHEPDTIFVFPINGGDQRYPPEAKARVWRSRDAGETWSELGDGLPDDFFVAVMRDAMCADAHDRAGPLLRRPQRRRLGLRRRGRDLAPDRRRPPGRDGRPGGCDLGRRSRPAAPARLRDVRRQLAGAVELVGRLDRLGHAGGDRAAVGAGAADHRVVAEQAVDPVALVGRARRPAGCPALTTYGVPRTVSAHVARRRRRP